MDDVTAAFGSFAVNDGKAAREFYGRTLGLAITDAGPGGEGPFWLTAGDGPGAFVYPKPDHEPAGFTVLNLKVGDLEGAGGRVEQPRHRHAAPRRYSAGRARDLPRGGPLDGLVH